MRFGSILLSGVIALAANQATLVQGFWLEKDWRQWSEKECRKMLEDSPWARSQSHTRTYVELMGSRTRTRELQASPRFEYVAQIRSALPIRQALVRQRELEAGKGMREQQETLDQPSQEFLAREFPDVIIIYVMYGSNVMTYSRDLSRHWEALPQETANKEIQLIAPGRQRIYPLTYTPVGGGGGAFQVTFPKQIDKGPILTPDAKELRLEFRHPDIGQQGEAHLWVTFDLRKMTVDGKILY